LLLAASFVCLLVINTLIPRLFERKRRDA